MKIISWNIRGLNSKSRQWFLRNRLKEEQLDILLIQETKCKDEIATSLLQKSWNSLEIIATDAQGFSRGMAIAWNRNEVEMTQFWTTKGTITGHFTYIGTSTIGFVTNVYGRTKQLRSCNS
jgi:exonuclease III